jgi:hypothetical protein
LRYWSWIHRLAQLLDQDSVRVEAEGQLLDYAASLPRGTDFYTGIFFTA